MASTRPLHEVLADWRGEAAVLRRRGSEKVAEVLEQCATDVARSAEEYLLFLEEDEAMLRTGKSKSWLRDRFVGMQADGHAYIKQNRRYYRAMLLPRRAHRDQLVAEGRRLAQGVANG